MKKVTSLFLVVVLVFSMSISAFAATADKTVTSSGTMSLYLDANKSGTSQDISFNFSSLPANAVVTKVVVDASTNISSGGLGAIVSERIYVKNSNMTSYASAAFATNKKTEVSAGLVGVAAKGTWYVSFSGTNISSYNSALLSYNNVKLTVYYNY